MANSLNSIFSFETPGVLNLCKFSFSDPLQNNNVNMIEILRTSVAERNDSGKVFIFSIYSGLNGGVAFSRGTEVLRAISELNRWTDAYQMMPASFIDTQGWK